MDVKRGKELVNQYHFDVRNLKWEEENGTPQTRIHVEFQLIERNEETKVTSIVTVLQFMIVLEDFVISGVMTQPVHIQNRLVESPSEFTEEDKHFLALPLLDMLRRLTYEVTEIAFDAPGVKLEL